MEQADIEQMQKFWPDVNLEDHVKSTCGWEGKIQDLNVEYGMTKRPRIMRCPQCREELWSSVSFPSMSQV